MARTHFIQSLNPGGLHRSLGIPEGQKIPASKMKGALAGDYGPKAKKQAQTAKTLEGPKVQGRIGKTASSKKSSASRSSSSRRR